MPLGETNVPITFGYVDTTGEYKGLPPITTSGIAEEKVVDEVHKFLDSMEFKVERIQRLFDKKESTKAAINSVYGASNKLIEKVIFHYPATVIYWKDGDKTVAKCGKDDTFDPEKGFAVACAKHFMGGLFMKQYEKFTKDKTFYGGFVKIKEEDLEDSEKEPEEEFVYCVTEHRLTRIGEALVEDDILLTVHKNESDAVDEVTRLMKLSTDYPFIAYNVDKRKLVV